jgi:hypothetical protein
MTCGKQATINVTQADVRMPLHDHIAIDFEASCLPRHGLSFPIEVGIAGPEGARSWLIRPMAGAAHWHWTPEASALHGIAPDRLERDGLPAHQVYAQLTHAICGRRIVADSPVDAYWWRILAGAAGEEVDGEVTPIATIFDEWGVLHDDIMAAQGAADAQVVGRHRAADDALWLWTLLTELDRHRPVRFVPPATPPSVPAYALTV